MPCLGGPTGAGEAARVLERSAAAAGGYGDGLLDGFARTGRGHTTAGGRGKERITLQFTAAVNWGALCTVVDPHCRANGPQRAEFAVEAPLHPLHASSQPRSCDLERGANIC